MTAGRDSAAPGRGAFRLRCWQILHFWHYFPEVRYFFWGLRLRMSLAAARRRGRTPILFSLTVCGHSQFLAPILDALRARPEAEGLEIYLTVDEIDEVPAGPYLGVPRWRIRPYREYYPFMERFAAYFASAFAARHPTPKCPVRVSIGHGLPSKVLALTPEWARPFTHVFISGPLSQKLYNTLVDAHPEYRTALVPLKVGCPKLDGLFSDAKPSRESLLERFQLDPAKPVVLYSPAFDPGASLQTYGEDVFRKLSELKDVNVLVKLHPVSYDRSVTSLFSNGTYWPDVLKKYESPTFRHAGNMPILSCLFASDVMLTDVSGVAWEFLLMDKPVLYFDSPKFFENIAKRYGFSGNVSENPLVNVGRRAGYILRRLEDLPDMVRRAVSRPGEMSEARRQAKEQLLFNPGRASGVAAETILRLLGLSKSVGESASGERKALEILPGAMVGFGGSLRTGP